jgi:hypothetical protein
MKDLPALLLREQLPPRFLCGPNAALLGSKLHGEWDGEKTGEEYPAEVFDHGAPGYESL